MPSGEIKCLSAFEATSVENEEKEKAASALEIWYALQQFLWTPLEADASSET